ncbi:AAA family ATPase [Candidatus Poribacteria bacterium]|nr:AAA family ATPase [Candidatus Poribacteria bacterium]
MPIIDSKPAPIGEKTMDVHIKAKNFGPIEKAEIDLRPLTVFVGESNTGKTYLAALIYALHQNFRGISQFPWASSAASYFSFISRSRDHRSQSRQEEVVQEMLKVLEKLNTPGRHFRFSDLPQQMSSRSQSILTDQENFTYELQRCFDLESASKLIRFTGSQDNEMKVSLSVRESDQTYWDFETRVAGSDNPTITGHINPDMILLNAKDPMRRDKFNETSDVERLFQTLSGQRWRAVDSYYLPAARSGIMQSRDVLSTALIKRATRIGLDRLEASTFSGMIADFLEQIFQYREPKRLSSKISRVAKQLETELLEGKIEVKRPTSEAYPEFLYRPEQAEDGLRMSHSSAMVSELAPLVLFLRGIVKQGDLLIIEEPESHLHPMAQTKIAQTLARLIRVGVQVVITTHSNYLLQQIGNLIREGELRKQGESTSESVDYLKEEEVGAWWFHKNKAVTELPFDLTEGIEPEDHLDIAEDLYNRSAGLQNRIEETKGRDAVESE